MKQLFLKSNLLHIRTNEGEFKVSNPEIIGDPETIKILFNDGKPFGGMPIEPVWPGGVELIETCKWRGNRDACANEVCWDLEQCQGNPTIKLARLLPKEEKKEPFVKALDDIQKIENLSVNNSAHSYTESAYKTVSSNTQTCGKFEIKSHYDFEPVESSEPAESAYKELEEAAIKQGHVIESSEPQEDRFNQALIEVPQDIKDQVEFEHNAINEAWELWGNIAKKDNVNPQAFVFGYVEAKKKYAVSAPSESQEELWNEVNEHINAQIGDYISLEAVKLSFILTRKPE